MTDWKPWPPPFNFYAKKPFHTHVEGWRNGPMGASRYCMFDVSGVRYETMESNGGASWRVVDVTPLPAPPSEGEVK